MFYRYFVKQNSPKANIGTAERITTAEKLNAKHTKNLEKQEKTLKTKTQLHQIYKFKPVKTIDANIYAAVLQTKKTLIAVN